VAQDGRFYLVSWLNLAERRPLVHRIGKVLRGYDGQDYFLYVVGEDHPDARAHGVPCTGPHPALRRG
jgi:hypothetical protein